MSLLLLPDQFSIGTDHFYLPICFYICICLTVYVYVTAACSSLMALMKHIHTYIFHCVCVCVCLWESAIVHIMIYLQWDGWECVCCFFIYCCCFIFLLDGYFFVLLLVPLVALSTQIQSLHSSISVTFPTRIFVVCFMHTLCCFSMFSIFSTILATVFLLLVMTLVCMANVGGTAMCGEQRRYFFQSSLPILPSFGLPIIVEYSSIFTKTKMYNSDVNS